MNPRIPRQQYLETAKHRRATAYRMHKSGAKWDAICERLQCSRYAAMALARRYRQIDLP